MRKSSTVLKYEMLTRYFQFLSKFLWISFWMCFRYLREFLSPDFLISSCFLSPDFFISSWYFLYFLLIFYVFLVSFLFIFVGPLSVRPRAGVRTELMNYSAWELHRPPKPYIIQKLPTCTIIWRWHTQRQLQGHLAVSGQFGTGPNLAPDPIWHQECCGVNLTPRV